MKQRILLLTLSVLLTTFGFLLSATQISAEGSCEPDAINTGELYEPCGSDAFSMLNKNGIDTTLSA